MSEISRFEWALNHENRIVFVMIDGSGAEVSGLGSNLTMNISINGGSLNPVGGTISEIGSGGYTYLCTVAEASTPGPIFITAIGAGTVQQNLEYVVSTRVQNTKSYTYPVTRSDTGNPVPNATVEIYTTSTREDPIWTGVTDEFGHARDGFGALPILQIGKTYWFWTSKVGLQFPNPDEETVA